MAEVVGLVVSVVQLAGAVIKIGTELYKNFQDGPRELRAILLETASLKAQLELIDLFTESSSVASREDDIKVQIQNSENILGDMQTLLEPSTREQPRKDKRAMARSRDAVMQLLKKPEINQKLEEPRCCRNSLNHTLTANIFATVRQVADDVTKIKDKLEESERCRILKELVTVDPSGNHREACHLHDPHTSAWITRSAEWKAWIDGSLRLWWVDGIPGAGKTCLASHLIEKVKEVQALAEEQKDCPSPTIGWSYYYCYHARSHISENDPFLRWVVNTLCRQAGFVPQEVAGRDTRDLTTQHLWDAFLTLATHFDKVFIMIDALDECQGHPGFLELIKRLCGVGDVSLLVTSRDEVDIRRFLERIATRLSLSEPLHPELEKDISEHIRSQLSSGVFQSWSNELRAEVQFDLLSKSHGMFRWVSCQLEVLGRLKQVSAVRQALEELPKTLDATYDRILCKIPEESKRMARNALALSISGLLCVVELDHRRDQHAGYNWRPFPDVLMEAIRWVDTEDASQDSDLLSADALFEFCICLLRKDVDGKVSIAHRTVRDYLQSPRIAASPAHEFYLPVGNPAALYHTVLVNRLLSPNMKFPMLSNPDYLSSRNPASFRLWQHCTNELPKRLRFKNDLEISAISADESVCRKVFRLLDSRRGHIAKIRSAIATVYGQFRMESRDFWEYTPVLLSNPALDVHSCAEVVIRLCVQDAWHAFRKYIDHQDTTERTRLLALETRHPMYGDCTLIEIAALQGFRSQQRWIEYLLLEGPKPGSCNKILLYTSHNTIMFGSSHSVKEVERLLFRKALGAGALANPQNAPITPLQVAVLKTNPGLVSLLLAAGAAPDSVADKPPSPSDAYPGGFYPGRRSHSTSPIRFKECQIFGKRKALDICRYICQLLRSEGSMDGSNDRDRAFERYWDLERAEKIEQLLIEHHATGSSDDGLKAFIDSMPDLEEHGGYYRLRRCTS